MLNPPEFYHIRSHLSVFDTVQDFVRFMKWKEKPILIDEHIEERGLLTDINNRRRIDAEIVSLICRNSRPNTCLEIGTARGISTARIAVNAPRAEVYTVNIPEEDYEEGGIFRTSKLGRQEIGSFYREKGIENITQIFANTATWEPDIANVDFAMIDGCHDKEFVYTDTCKVKKILNKGAFMIWHDFNPELTNRHSWLHSVMTGMEWLYADKILSGDLYYIRNSWFAIKHFTQ